MKQTSKQKMKHKILKHILFAFIAVVTLGMATTVHAKKVQVPKMYIFGMSASFNDTIVYFTNVQDIDSAWIESKNDFLQTRDLYSNQLRDYLAVNKQMPHRTCIVVANKNRKKLEKKYLKMVKLYTQSKDNKAHYDIRYLEDKDFHFKTINLADYYDDVNAQQ